MRLTVLSSCLLALVPILAGSTWGDVVLPGQRIIKVQCKLDLGLYQENAARRYMVKDGDTLQKIATSELGSSERSHEIPPVNGKDALQALKAGQVIWLPAAKASKDWWHFYAARGGGNFGAKSLERIGHGDTVPWHQYYTSVFAVRSDQHAAFLKDLENRDGREVGTLIRDWTSKAGFVVGDEVLPGRATLINSSHVHKRIETWRVKKLGARELKLERSSQHDFDARDKPVVRKSGAFGGNGLLLALSFLALCGIVELVRRRRIGSEIA